MYDDIFEKAFFLVLIENIDIGLWWWRCLKKKKRFMKMLLFLFWFKKLQMSVVIKNM